jgi:hypothetical protein
MKVSSDSNAPPPQWAHPAGRGATAASKGFKMFRLPLALPALAQSAVCPNGITLAYDDGGHRTLEGADPSDPMMCRYSLSNGQERRLLFNYYSLRTGSDYSAARPVLQQFFSGQQREVSFRVQLQTSGPGIAGVNQYQVTWRYLADDTLTIGKNPYPTRVVECDMQGQNGNSFHSNWRLWMARDKLMFLKGEYHLLSGYEWAGSSQHNWRVVRMRSD